MTPTERAAQIAGYREMADFLEQHPEVPMPVASESLYFWNKKEFLSAASSLAKAGGVEKISEEGDYKVRRMFGPVRFTFSIRREIVCQLVTPAVYDCPDSLLEEAVEYREA
jgi:hypothetical protein